MKYTVSALAAILTVGASAKDSRTFAVLRFNGDGFMTEGRVDPIVNPGGVSTHMHGIMGGSNFGATVQGDQLLKSSCTNAKIANDFSNYWIPNLWFQDPKNGSLAAVPMFYMNVYYFFEATDDEIKAFPPGLKMLTGDPNLRSPPAGGGVQNLVQNDKPIQPIGFTCPRTNYNIPSYPKDSDGSKTGMGDPNNAGQGAGFPGQKCTGVLGSPMRQDLHFPSCYDESKGLDDHKNNMVWPVAAANGKANCPKGTIHVPHLFFEIYWDTKAFDDLWTPNEDGTGQPYVLSNGDATGYSSHGDFIAGWDESTLQHIIDTCDAGSSGMDNCPNIPGGLNKKNDCKITLPNVEGYTALAMVNTLPGDCQITGFGKGGVTGGSVAAPIVAPQANSSIIASSGATISSASSAAASLSVSKATKGNGSAKATASPSTVGNKSNHHNIVQASSAPLAALSQAPVAKATSPVVITDAAGGTLTVWDVVTEYETMTIFADAAPTAAAKRDHHDHMARHKAGRFGRR